MSDFQDMGQELTVMDMDPFEDGPALDLPSRLTKRSVSVKQPATSFQTYGEGLACYCMSGTPTIPQKHTEDGSIQVSEQVKAVQAKAKQKRRPIQQATIEFIEKEKEIYEE